MMTHPLTDDEAMTAFKRLHAVYNEERALERRLEQWIVARYGMGYAEAGCDELREFFVGRWGAGPSSPSQVDEWMGVAIADGGDPP